MMMADMFMTDYILQEVQVFLLEEVYTKSSLVFTTDSKRKNYKNAAFAAFFVLRRLENLRQALFC